MKVTRLSVLALAAAMAAPSLAADPGAKPRDPSERKICKNFQEIGSLVRRKRICKTAAEWDAERALLRQQVGITSCSQQPCEPGGK